MALTERFLVHGFQWFLVHAFQDFQKTVSGVTSSSVAKKKFIYANMYAFAY